MTMLINCKNCTRSFYASRSDQYCPECWSAWCRNDGDFENRTHQIDYTAISKAISEKFPKVMAELAKHEATQ